MSTLPKQSYWRIIGRQFRRNRLAQLGLSIVALLFLIALAAPMLASDKPLYMVHEGKAYWLPNLFDYKALRSVDFRRWEPAEGEPAVRTPVPYSPTQSNLRKRLKPPTRDNLLGTDDRGRDVLSRLIWGTRIAMSIGFVSVGISVTIGMLIGATAGYFGGKVDLFVLRCIEVMMCFPTFILILSLRAFLPPNIYTIMIVIGITGWTGVARLVRGEFLRLRETDFATAARATGLSHARVMFRHLLPNALAPVWVSATFGIAGAILIESALSFLGFGVPPPTASWGEVLQQSKQYLIRDDSAWWLVTFPGLAIFLTVTAFNLVGEGLRDAMDPRLRQ
ncbi:MAG: ABC transporter permease subunit [Nitrospiraceae bacterium]|nr:ABC transporter permease subunit [Nitrospiraceae bacterium]